MIVLPRCLCEHAGVRQVHCGIRWKHVGVWRAGVRAERKVHTRKNTNITFLLTSFLIWGENTRCTVLHKDRALIFRRFCITLTHGGGHRNMFDYWWKVVNIHSCTKEKHIFLNQLRDMRDGVRHKRNIFCQSENCFGIFSHSSHTYVIVWKRWYHLISNLNLLT